jgi:membrane protein implicated in regulation of membrane protease activity
MRFQVPQFIETETKVVGPFTLRQFMFVVGGVSMLILEYMLLGFGLLWLVAAIPTVGLFGALAFVKIGGQPFLNFLAFMLAYAFGAKRYYYRVKQDDTITPFAHGK